MSPEAVERPAAARAANAQEAERARSPLLPAWRDPTGHNRDSLGRSTSSEELARIADRAPAAMREVEAQKDYLRGAYRDPGQAADGLDKLIEKSGRHPRAAARTLREDGSEVLGTLRGREEWLAGRVAQDDRARQVGRRRDRRQPGARGGGTGCCRAPPYRRGGAAASARCRRGAGGYRMRP